MRPRRSASSTPWPSGHGGTCALWRSKSSSRASRSIVAREWVGMCVRWKSTASRLYYRVTVRFVSMPMYPI